MKRLLVVSALMMLFSMTAIQVSASGPPGYEEVPFGDGAICNFTGSEARYGTPGYPDEANETVLEKVSLQTDGQGRVHGSVKQILDGVRYDLLEGDGPTSFLAYGTFNFGGWSGDDRGFGRLVWSWTLTDLDGNPLGKTGGTIIDFGTGPDDPRLVQNWRGPCIEP